MNVGQSSLIAALRIYRWVLSPLKSLLFGPLGRCRFDPTCSDYAIQAVRQHGTVLGGWLSVKRLCRCHPWGSYGNDPVPPKGHRTSPGANSINLTRLPSNEPVVRAFGPRA